MLLKEWIWKHNVPFFIIPPRHLLEGISWFLAGLVRFGIRCLILCLEHQREFPSNTFSKNVSAPTAKKVWYCYPGGVSNWGSLRLCEPHIPGRGCDVEHESWLHLSGCEIALFLHPGPRSNCRDDHIMTSHRTLCISWSGHTLSIHPNGHSGSGCSVCFRTCAHSGCADRAAEPPGEHASLMNGVQHLHECGLSDVDIRGLHHSLCQRAKSEVTMAHGQAGLSFSTPAQLDVAARLGVPEQFLNPLKTQSFTFPLVNNWLNTPVWANASDAADGEG